MTSQPFFQNTLIFRRPGVDIFADIKIVNVFIETIIQDSRKAKRIVNYVSKSNLYLHLFDVAKSADFSRKNADAGRTQGMCHVIYIFWVFLRQGITVPSFVIVGCVKYM